MRASKCLYNTACPACSKTGKGSSLSVFVDGGSYCHECGYTGKDHESEEVYRVEEKQETITPLYREGKYRDIPSRGLSKATCERLGIQCGKINDQKVFIFEKYNDNGSMVGQKIRTKDKPNRKEGIGFWDHKGDKSAKNLFGYHAFKPDDKTPIFVTEGEFDAAAIYEATGYPAVSITDGSGGAEKSISQNLEYLNGFRYVVLVFDQDEAGNKAQEKCIDLFEPGKVRIAHLPEKDANEMLMLGRERELSDCLSNAQEIKEEDIITLDQISLDDLRELVVQGMDLPFPELNNMIGGLRPKRVYTLVAREKAGKTTTTKEIVFKLLDQGKKVGVLYLEGDSKEEALSFVAMERRTPTWEMVDKLSDEDYLVGVHADMKKFKDVGLYLYDHKGAIDGKTVKSKLTYMAKAMKCDAIILDNISITVAGGDVSSNERKQIDKMVYDIVSLAKNSGTTILNVVHLTKNRKDKDGNDSEEVSRADICGSGAFAKFSDVVIALERNPSKGTVRTKVLANRVKGTEGYADTLKYDSFTGRLNVVEHVEEDEEDL